MAAHLVAERRGQSRQAALDEACAPLQPMFPKIVRASLFARDPARASVPRLCTKHNHYPRHAIPANVETARQWKLKFAPMERFLQTVIGRHIHVGLTMPSLTGLAGRRTWRSCRADLAASLAAWHRRRRRHDDLRPSCRIGFATGGIGGVHRGAETSFDISADLRELAETPVTVVAAGAKAILDLSKTLE
jgi:hypothetical protein